MRTCWSEELGAAPERKAAPDSSINNREGAHWKRSHTLHFYRHREELERAIGQPIEVAHVLDDWNPGGQQNAVRRSRQISSVIDIVRVDTNQSRASVGEKLSRISGEKR